MSPISRHSVRDASPIISTEISLKDFNSSQQHINLVRQQLFADSDKLVVEKDLTFRMKTAALKQGMNNMKKSCIHMLRDGVLEYMRLAVEELVEISKSSRNLNAF